MPEKAPKQPILLGIAEHSECVSASNGAIAYSCYKIGRACQPDLCSYLFHFFRKLPEFCVVRLGWCTWSFLFSNRHTGLSWGLHGDIYGRKEEGIYRHPLALLPPARCAYHLAHTLYFPNVIEQYQLVFLVNS